MGDVKAIFRQATIDRMRIVGNYLKGREGADINQWEDPEFEVYHVTDRYGFIHNQHLSSSTDGNELKIELERAQKWVKMLKNWNKYYPSEKLTRRIYKGIPDRLRGEVWSRLLGVGKMKKEQQGVYATMKKRAHDKSTYIHQIDLDVNRTYRNHIMFRDRFGVKQQALFHVLAAYSVYNSEVGYCQGMSEIAALLLMYLNEEDAFWALSQLLSDKRHGMHGFFIPGFPKLIRFQEHHDNVLRKFLPKVHKYMDRIDVYPSLYAIKWFLQCFLDRTPFTMTLRLWDVYMLEGERLLVAMAYTIIKLHKRRLLKMAMEELLAFFQETLEKNFFFSDNIVLDQIQVSLEELRKASMDIPPKGRVNESPTLPFGLEIEPSIDQLTTKADPDSTEEHFRKNSSKTKSLHTYDGVITSSLRSNRDSLVSVNSSVYETAGTESRVSIPAEGQGNTNAYVASSRTSVANQSDVGSGDFSRQSSPLYHDAGEQFSGSPQRVNGSPQKFGSPRKSTTNSPLKVVNNANARPYINAKPRKTNVVQHTAQAKNNAQDAVGSEAQNSVVEEKFGKTIILSMEESFNKSILRGVSDDMNSASPRKLVSDDKFSKTIPTSVSDSRIAYNHTVNKTVVYVNGYDNENGSPTRPDDGSVTHTFSSRKKAGNIADNVNHNTTSSNSTTPNSASRNIILDSPSPDFQYDRNSPFVNISVDTSRQSQVTSFSPEPRGEHSPFTNISYDPDGNASVRHEEIDATGHGDGTVKPTSSVSDSFITRKKHNDDIRDAYYRRLSSPQMAARHTSPSRVKNARNYRSKSPTTHHYASKQSRSSPPPPTPPRSSLVNATRPSPVAVTAPQGTTMTVYDVGDKPVMRHTVL